MLKELVLGVCRLLRLRLRVQRDDERLSDERRVRGVGGDVRGEPRRRGRPSRDAVFDRRVAVPGIAGIAVPGIPVPADGDGIFAIHRSAFVFERVPVPVPVPVPARPRLPQARVQRPPVPAVAPPRPHRVVEQEARRVRGGARRAQSRRRERLRASLVASLLGRRENRRFLFGKLSDGAVGDVIHDGGEREVDVQVVEPNGVLDVRLAPEQAPRRDRDRRRPVMFQSDGDGGRFRGERFRFRFRHRAAAGVSRRRLFAKRKHTRASQRRRGEGPELGEHRHFARCGVVSHQTRLHGEPRVATAPVGDRSGGLAH